MVLSGSCLKGSVGLVQNLYPVTMHMTAEESSWGLVSVLQIVEGCAVTGNYIEGRRRKRKRNVTERYNFLMPLPADDSTTPAHP